MEVDFKLKIELKCMVYKDLFMKHLIKGLHLTLNTND